MAAAVIVLAAGLSQRFGNGDKLMAQVGGRAMIAHVLDVVRAVDAGQRVVVTQAGSGVIGLAEGFEVVINGQPERGMGRSIALGVAALRADIEAVFIALGDMPFIGAEAYGALMAGLADCDVVVPVHEGQRGHPVLFGRACFEALRRLDGAEGARSVMGNFRVRTMAVAGLAGVTDLDTPEDFAGL